MLGGLPMRLMLAHEYHSGQRISISPRLAANALIQRPEPLIIDFENRQVFSRIFDGHGATAFALFVSRAANAAASYFGRLLASSMASRAMISRCRIMQESTRAAEARLSRPSGVDAFIERSFDAQLITLSRLITA
jgi:hypothetical protein